MSSSTKQKYINKPFIKKIYETHKKWLGNDSKSSSKKKSDENVDTVVIPPATIQKVYTDNEICNSYPANEEELLNKFDSINSDKLRSVINNFDKILDEYSSISSMPGIFKEMEHNSINKIETEKSEIEKSSDAVDSGYIPSPSISLDLGTTDTEEIIQPKIIPRRSKLKQLTTEKPIEVLDRPTFTSTPKEKGLAKNLSLNLGSRSTGIANTKIPKLVKAKTCSIIESKCILKKTNSNPLSNSSNNFDNLNITKSMTNISVSDSQRNKIFDIPLDDEKTKQKLSKNCDLSAEASNKVKEMVKRLNSLTDNFDDYQNNPKEISKAISSTNLSLSKIHGSMSKIPVNLSLRKSIPNHLDKLDDIESTTTEPKKEAKIAKARSVQNLSKSRLSLPKPINNATKNLSASVVDLNKNKSPRDINNKVLTKPKSVRDLSFDQTKTKNTNSGSRLKTQYATKESKSVSDLSIRRKSEPIHVKPKPIINTNLKAIKAKVEKSKVDPKDGFVVVKGPKDKYINSTIKKLEQHKAEDKLKPHNKVVRNQTYKKGSVEETTKGSDFSGVKKLQTEPKNVDKSIKPAVAKVPLKKSVSGGIKLDLKKTEAFLAKVDPYKNLNYPKNFVSVSEKCDKNVVKRVLDYDSDHSNDSGHISNENDEVHSTSSGRSRTSTESLDATTPPGHHRLSIKTSVDSEGFSEKEEIFFRTGIISQLEAQRDEKLAGVVISLQSHCRGYLARRKLQKKKLEDLAVRCIQRNVRKFMLVRDWPWWRLLVRVTPLLNVHRTEEELRAKTEELEALKLKLQKVENERTSFKQGNEKLEAKVRYF